MRILATGTDGYIGGHLARVDPSVVALGRDAGDIETLGPRISAERPDAVIHCAAMTSIAACAARPEEARRVNVEGTRAIARVVAVTGARLVHVSTDQVYDGTGAPYREDDPPTPISRYGETKAEAERVALDVGGDDTLVVRVHLVVGTAVPPRRSGTDHYLSAVRKGERPPLFEDEFRSPIHVVDAVRALLELAASGPTGVLLLGGPERLSRLEIGRIMLRAAGLDETRAHRSTIRDYDGPPRTPDTAFDSSRAFALLETPIRPIEEALTAELSE
jgi:dTDP-4-dehydrorhamnose reductase